MFAKLVYKFVLPNLQMLNALLRRTYKRASESEMGRKIRKRRLKIVGGKGILTCIETSCRSLIA
jgi:hypothetical protein